MSNLKADFELKPSAEYKKAAREVGKIVYKGDKFMRYISLCDFAAIIIGMIFITLLCVKFYINDLGCLLEDYGYESAAILPYLAWIGAFLTMLYATGLRPWLLIRTMLSRANYGEFGPKSVILEDGFFVQKANSARADIFITSSATPATSVVSSSLSSQTPCFVPCRARPSQTAGRSF